MTPGQIQALTTFQVSKLLPISVSGFTITQISVLSPMQIMALTPSELININVTSISYLLTSQVTSFTTDQISVLTTREISAFTSSQIQILLTTQLGAISLIDIANLLLIDVPIFLTTQIIALTTKQIGSLSQSQINMLTPSQILALSPEYRNILNIPFDKLLLTPDVITFKDLYNLPLSKIQEYMALETLYSYEFTLTLNIPNTNQGTISYFNLIAKEWISTALQININLIRIDSIKLGSIIIDYHILATPEQITNVIKNISTDISQKILQTYNDKYNGKITPSSSGVSGPNITGGISIKFTPTISPYSVNNAFINPDVLRWFAEIQAHNERELYKKQYKKYYETDY